MPLNKKSLFFFKILIPLLGILTVFGCAVPQKPRGGPKDVVAPKLLKATPANQTHNFHDKIIRLDFDEPFKLNNVYQEITISPTPEKPPVYKVSEKSLFITLKDTLQKNTTYVINFGKAIGDLTENNLVKNLTYVFSTGTHVDSLSLSGSVINVQTQAREKDVTVMLFNLRQDSLLFGKKKPPVFTTTDTSGNWTLGNLHEGMYKLYALKETGGGDKVYNNDNELIGIPGKIINLQTDSANIKLRLFKPAPEKFKFTDHRFENDGHIFLIMNRPVDKPSLRIIYPEAQNTDKIVEFNRTNDTAQLYIKNMDFDSLRVALFENGKPLDSVSFRKGRKETYTRNLTVVANSDTRNLLRKTDDFKFTTNTPISSYDASLITINEDSTAVTNFILKQDSLNLKKFSISYKWKLNVPYTVTFGEGALVGYFGEKNKRLAPKHFKIDKSENYGLLNLKVMVPDTNRYYILEFYTEQNTLLQRTRPFQFNQQITFRSLLSGKYNIKVVYDDNKNGKWDSGSIKAMRQPENIWVNPTKIAVRGDFETNSTIEIPPEPAP